jgi:hypothetical protein
MIKNTKWIPPAVELERGTVTDNFFSKMKQSGPTPKVPQSSHRKPSEKGRIQGNQTSFGKQKRSKKMEHQGASHRVNYRKGKMTTNLLQIAMVTWCLGFLNQS